MVGELMQEVEKHKALKMFSDFLGMASRGESR